MVVKKKSCRACGSSSVGTHLHRETSGSLGVGVAEQLCICCVIVSVCGQADGVLLCRVQRRLGGRFCTYDVDDYHKHIVLTCKGRLRRPVLFFLAADDTLWAPYWAGRALGQSIKGWCPKHGPTTSAQEAYVHRPRRNFIHCCAHLSLAFLVFLPKKWP